LYLLMIFLKLGQSSHSLTFFFKALLGSILYDLVSL
jgi:hypothetical protein